MKYSRRDFLFAGAGALGAAGVASYFSNNDPHILEMFGKTDNGTFVAVISEKGSKYASQLVVMGGKDGEPRIGPILIKDDTIYVSCMLPGGKKVHTGMYALDPQHPKLDIYKGYFHPELQDMAIGGLAIAVQRAPDARPLELYFGGDERWVVAEGRIRPHYALKVESGEVVVTERQPCDIARDYASLALVRESGRQVADKQKK